MEGDTIKVLYFQINRSYVICSHFVMNLALRKTEMTLLGIMGEPFKSDVIRE